MISTRIIEPTPSAYNPPLLIKSILERSLNYNLDTEILYRDQVRMNYHQLHKRIAQLAHALVEMGVQPGDVIGVLEVDSHRYLELYFAVPMIGAVLHTINFRLSPDQVVYTMNHAEDKVVFCHQMFAPLINGIHPHLNTVEKYVILKDEGQEVKVDFPIEGEYEDLIAHQSEEYDYPDFDENTMASLFYTTGTTGLPKGVCFSHRQLVLHTLGVSMSFAAVDTPIAITARDVYMPMTPMFHVHAWGVPYLATLLGMKQIYPGAYEPNMLMKLIKEEQVTFSHCVPTILNLIVNHPKANEKGVLDRVKMVIGGAALPKGLAQAALEKGINVLTGYGMSETCPIISIAYLSESMQQELTKEQQLDERVKTGRAVLFVEAKLMDDDSNFLPHDGKSVGELVVRAPWLTQRYYKEEERSEELWEHGYLHTGDMAVIEPNGTIIIVDRKKDVIKSGGEWISSLELEGFISTHPAVKEAAIIGIPDEKWDERPFALIIPHDGQSIQEDDIKTHLLKFAETGELSKWAIPEAYRFVSEIPKTSVGKIDKKEIRKMYVEKKI